MTRPAICLLPLRFERRALLLMLNEILAAAAITLFLCLKAAYAGSFAIDPVRLDLSDSQTSAVIHVQNNGEAPITIEARSFLWSQSNGKDQMTLTRDVIITPQIFRMNPGATQVLRVGALRRPDALQEIAYRLILEEILPPPSPTEKGVRVALRISMPLFFRPTSDAKEKIHMAASIESGQQLKLKLSNSGQAAAHFSEIMLLDEEDPSKPITMYTASTYVLPGQERELLLKSRSPNPPKKILIKARTHTGPMEFHVVLASD